MALTRKEFGKVVADGLTKLCREIEADRKRRGDKSRLEIPFGPMILVFQGKK